MAKQAAKKAAAPKKSRILKSSHHFAGLGTFEAGAEVTAEMEKAFNKFQDECFDKDYKGKQPEISSLDNFCE